MNNKKKINIYRQDLKNAEFRIIDKDKYDLVFDNNETEQEYYNQKLDTLDLRLKEFEKENYQFLDLSNLGIDNLPNLDKKLCSKVKYLFLNNNNFTIFPNLDIFININVLDIAHNKIKVIDNIPNILNELVCSNNLLEKINIPNNLKILICSNNKLKNIRSSNLEILNCEYNFITEINNQPNLKKLLCQKNNIIKLENMNNLEYLDVSYNSKIEKIINMPKLKDLLANSIPNLFLGDLNNLEYLEIYDSFIENLYYLPKLKDLHCYINSIKNMSSEYKINKTKIIKDKLISIEFDI
jgi:Leucine-rich repeat (LRR) protein